jgi:hypothetical protein
VAEVEDEITLPEGATSLHFMQAIYRDPKQPLTRRLRAAQIAIAYEHPKLAVTVNTEITGFAAQMEAMNRASGRSNVIGSDRGMVYDTSPEYVDRVQEAIRAGEPIPSGVRKLAKPSDPIQTDPSQGGFRRRF